MIEQQAPAPVWVRATTVVAVSVVAAVAAIASYNHMFALAVRAGEEWRAVLAPLSVDGLLVASSLAVLVRRRAGQRAGLLPWAGLTLGIVASLAANIASARPEPLAWIVAGWPPVALAVSFELLIRVTRDRPGPARANRGQAAPITVADAVAAADRPDRPTSPAEARPGLVAGQPDIAPPPDRTEGQMLDELRALADRIGRRPGRNTVRKELRVGSGRADRLLERFDQTGPRRTA